MTKALRIFQITHCYLKKYRNSKVISGNIRKKWAKEVLKLLNFEIECKGNAPFDGPVIYVANHISYIDIPLLMATLTDCVFVSKKEVASWPIIGSASRKIGTIFVDRKSAKSRASARNEIEVQLNLFSRKIVVFPSGTTSISGEDFWRKGVFELAHKLNIPIVPVRISYSKLRTVAFIKNDLFFFHLLKLAMQDLILAKVELHEPIIIRNIDSDLKYCKNWCTSKKEHINCTKNPSPFESAYGVTLDPILTR
jgi:1-acyl-sn-glycerol-3-phosphate acyltransferase